MNEEIRRKLVAQIADFHLPRYRELPDMGLYLEQVVRYVDRFSANPLTASMISNYVKQKIIPGPVKKVYGPESIAYLIFVSYVKTVLSMDGIRLMREIQEGSYTLEVAYDYFCSELENLLQFVYGVTQAPTHIGSQQDTPQKELLRTALLSVAYKEYLAEYLALLGSEKE